MKKVSRGTPRPRALTRGNVTTYYRLRPAFLAPWERDALAAGVMTSTRWAVTPENSTLLSGNFAALDLDSGRAWRDSFMRGGLVELRCRHRFPSGVRVVKVTPNIAEGDLYWVRDGDRAGSRKSSRFVLEVTGVDVARLQDMTDADALSYGVALLPDVLKETGTPRTWYQRSRPMAWAANDWVWVVAFKVHRENIDAFLNVRPRVTVRP